MTRSPIPATAAASHRHSPDVLWLANSLWAGCEVVKNDTRERAMAPLASFTILPSWRRPRVMVPAGRDRAARAALSRYNDGMSQAARIRNAAVGTALGVGLGRFIGNRIDVLAGPDPDTASLLIEELHRVFDLRRLAIAVLVGERRRPNRKPVLQVMTEDGDVLGYAKVGWNDLTKRLVANEAEVLRSMTSAPPETFEAPRLLHEAEVGDLRVTVVSAFAQNLLRRGTLGADAPLAAVREIASRGGTHDGDLMGSDYARALGERIASAADADRREALADALERIESQANGAVLTFGSWHGDWTPWNMSRQRSGLFVWDWERSGGRVPVGFDVLHHRFQFRRHRRREDVTAAASAARSGATETLLRLGVAASNHERLMQLYLLEMLLRSEEGRESGLPIVHESVALEDALRARIAST